MISILILTKNEEQDLPGCLESVRWSDDIHVFDSYSTDGTLDIARAAGAHITQRHFDNWSSHQNWGLANIPIPNPPAGFLGRALAQTRPDVFLLPAVVSPRKDALRAPCQSRFHR